jgi:hypothetical protein
VSFVHALCSRKSTRSLIAPLFIERKPGKT